MKTRLILLGVWGICLVGVLLELLVMLGAVFFNPTRAWLIALAADDAGNVALNGRLGQSISSHVAHAKSAGKWWGRWVCGGLNTVDPGHCERALSDPKQNLAEQIPSA